MAKVIHFEIPVLDPEKATEFYKNVFGWEFTRYPGPTGYWLITAGNEGENGINGALIEKSTGAEEPKEITDASMSVNSVVTLSVTDVEETERKVTENGGTVTTSINTVPKVGRMFYFRDPEANLLGAMQTDESAA
jgi:predicted enzyme related to lactoylglutathione lyase